MCRRRGNMNVSCRPGPNEASVPISRQLLRRQFVTRRLGTNQLWQVWLHLFFGGGGGGNEEEPAGG